MKENKKTDVTTSRKEIKFSWIERDVKNIERIGAMYCFSRCDVNTN